MLQGSLQIFEEIIQGSNPDLSFVTVMGTGLCGGRDGRDDQQNGDDNRNRLGQKQAVFQQELYH